MKIQYLEVVTNDVDAVCEAHAAAHNVKFGEPVAALGNARTAILDGGGFVGVRAPLRDTEMPLGRAAGGTPWILCYRSRTVIRAAGADK